MSIKFLSDREDPCPVCAKISGSRQDWPIVSSNENAVAFVPSRQPTVGTTLVVPRRHVFDPAELGEQAADDLYLLLRDMVDATMSTLKPNYYHISQYVGITSEEPFDHLHWRLEPRSEKPAGKFVPITEMPSMPLAERQRIADTLRGHFGSRGTEAAEAQPAHS